jgi:hypothetical protein
MDRTRLLCASGLLALAMALPMAVHAAGAAAPTEPCVPGTVWEDQTSGVKYLCVYDELFGGPRWVLLSQGQRGTAGMLIGSSAYGCLHLSVGIGGVAGSGADAVARTYRWPCSTIRDRITQPAGEIRSRVVIQRYGSGTWSTCRDSGYWYNASTAYGWVAGVDMGNAPDCGSGSYRAVGFGAYFQGGLWRGSQSTTPALWLP